MADESEIIRKCLARNEKQVRHHHPRTTLVPPSYSHATLVPPACDYVTTCKITKTLLQIPVPVSAPAPQCVGVEHICVK